MADRTDEMKGSARAAGTSRWHGATTEPHSIEEARDALAATRQRISQDLDSIEARLRGTAEGLRERLDPLEPARTRIRADVWASLGIAFAAGVALGLLTGRDHHGHRRLPARMLRRTAAKLPGAVLDGTRTGVAWRLRKEWRGRGRPALPRPAADTRGGVDPPRRVG
jgi:ElaB/YqjD/DUF883 family membrane-anchored ribosome-binding protein